MSTDGGEGKTLNSNLLNSAKIDFVPLPARAEELVILIKRCHNLYKKDVISYMKKMTLQPLWKKDESTFIKIHGNLYKKTWHPIKKTCQFL